MMQGILQNSSPKTKLALVAVVLLLSFILIYLAGNFILSMIYPELGDAFNGGTESIDTGDKSTVLALKLTQLFYSIFIFILPSLIVSYFIFKHPARGLRIKDAGLPIFYIITLFIIITGLPIINFTSYINSQLDLPSILDPVENWIIQNEENALNLTLAFLKTDTFGELLFNLLLLAIIPAIGEELLFRGILQPLLIDVFKNIHWGVILTSVLFSSMHFQFFGFIPRALLGLLFGYLVVWRGNLWFAIFAHFLNNAISVFMVYFTRHQYESYKTDAMPLDFGSITILAFSILFVLIGLWTFKNYVPLNRTV